MVFYLIFLGLSLSLIACGGRGNKWLYWCGVIVLFLVSACRFDVGQDFLQFYTLEVPPISEITLLPGQRGEGADFNRFGMSVKLLYLLSDWLHFRFLIFIVTSAIIYFGVGYVLWEESTSPLLSWCYFIGFMAVPSYNLIWQMSAMTFVLLSLRFVRQRCPFKFCAMILLAMTFHSSAIVGVLIYPLYHKVSAKWAVIGGVTVYFCSAVIFSIIAKTGLYAMYLDELDKYPGGEKLRLIYPLLVISLLVFSVFNRIQSSNLKGLFVIAIAGCVPPFIIGAHLGNRVGFYFTQFIMLIAPLALENRTFQKQVTGFMFFAFFFVTVMLSQKSPVLMDTHVPYRNIFTADTSYLRERSKDYEE